MVQIMNNEPLYGFKGLQALHWIWSPLAGLSFTENINKSSTFQGFRVSIQYMSRHLFFKDFQESPTNSSNFHARANPRGS